MKYHIRAIGSAPEGRETGTLSDPNIQDALRSIKDGRTILTIEKTSDCYIEIAARNNGYVATETYEGKRYHRREPLTLESAAELIQIYGKTSVSDANDWFPSLMDRKDLRFSSPRLFQVLNERFQVRSTIGFALFFTSAVLFITLGLSLQYSFGSARISIIAPTVIFAWITAKRFDFVDRRRRTYGYKMIT